MKSVPTVKMAKPPKEGSVGRRTASKTKPKVKLDGTRDPNCLNCPKKPTP